MAHFFQLQELMEGTLQEYLEMVQRADDERSNEVAAVTRIQSFLRGWQVRKSWYTIVRGALRIERIVRGWLGREKAKALREERARQLNMVFLSHCAAVIQKYFRGWSSRRNLHDYYGRKLYLETVAKRGAWTTEYLEREYQQKLQEAKAEEERAMRKEFDALAGELHHLVSTQTIPGVYNPPHSKALPQAFDLPIEQHLRDSLRVQLPKSLRRPRHRAAIANAASGEVTSKIADPQEDGRDRETTARAVSTGRLKKTQAKSKSELSADQPQVPDQELGSTKRTASLGRLKKIQGPFRSKEQIEASNLKAAQNWSSIQASGRYDAVEVDRRMQQKLSKLTRFKPNLEFVAPGFLPERPPPSSVNALSPFQSDMSGSRITLPKIQDKPPFFTALPRDKHFHDYGERPPVPSGQE